MCFNISYSFGNYKKDSLLLWGAFKRSWEMIAGAVQAVMMFHLEKRE